MSRKFIYWSTLQIDRKDIVMPVLCDKSVFCGLKDHENTGLSQRSTCGDVDPVNASRENLTGRDPTE